MNSRNHQKCCKIINGPNNRITGGSSNANNAGQNAQNNFVNNFTNFTFNNNVFPNFSSSSSSSSNNNVRVNFSNNSGGNNRNGFSSFTTSSNGNGNGNNVFDIFNNIFSGNDSVFNNAFFTGQQTGNVRSSNVNVNNNYEGQVIYNNGDEDESIEESRDDEALETMYHDHRKSIIKSMKRLAYAKYSETALENKQE